jgi:hypothetical protein
MRLLVTSLFAMTAAASANAATQQQCEALIKPIDAKFTELQKEEKPTPQACARWKDGLKMLEKYVAEADKQKCPLAYVSGKPAGGAEERAVMVSELKQALKEQCH